jgi:hypothetical protein
MRGEHQSSNKEREFSMTLTRTLTLMTQKRIPHGRRSVKRLWGALHNDNGSATAEYAIATMAAVGFAGMLVVILRGDEVRTILTDLVRRALTFAG